MGSSARSGSRSRSSSAPAPSSRRSPRSGRSRRKAVSASAGKLQIAVLERRPSAVAIAEIEALASDEDRLAVDGTELYWLPRGGTQESPLDMKAIDRTLGINTLRTMGTVEQLFAKFFD